MDDAFKSLSLSDWLTLAGIIVGIGLVIVVPTVITIYFLLEQMVKRMAGVKEEPQERRIVDQPVVIQLQKEFVSKASYEKHFENNREEHEALEAKLDKGLDAMREAITDLVREVSGTSTKVDAIAARQVQIDVKVDNIRFAASRTTGL
jgi:hypothetical protein